MNYDETITTAAPADRAWSALSDVVAYPKWTASMTSVEPLDEAALAVGRRFRIRQPGLPSVVWRVSEVTAGESFSWESSSPGVRTVGYHRLDGAGDATRISVGLRQTGPLAGLVRLFIAAKTRRYLALEVAGLKAAAEA
jgi:uncharacterized membrane protein